MAKQYYTLVSSLPDLPHFAAAEVLPISRERLEGRLKMLDPVDAADLRRTRSLIAWQEQPAMRTDEQVIGQFTSALRRMYPDLADEHIEEARVSRTRYVVAIPTIDYSARLPAIRTSVPGLFVVNSARIVDASLAVNDTVKLANAGAKLLLDST